MEELKKALIGETVKANEAKFKSILAEELKKPLTLDGSYCRCVCRKCQNIFEINEEISLGLIETMGILGSLPEIPANRMNDLGLYFEIGYCNLCEPEKEVHVAVKNF